MVGGTSESLQCHKEGFNFCTRLGVPDVIKPFHFLRDEKIWGNKRGIDLDSGALVSTSGLPLNEIRPHSQGGLAYTSFL